MNVLQQWHQAVKTRDMAILADILAEDVVFHSPVVWTPQPGKMITAMYLMAAAQVIGGEHFHYTKEIIGENQACLEFMTKIDDIVVNGVDIITVNEAGLISEFKVMVRPYKGMLALKEKMFEVMQKMGG